MLNKTRGSIRDSLTIIWIIASKDIADALKNRLVVTIIIMLSIMLLMPKMLPLVFEQPQIVLPVYEIGDSHFIEELKNNPEVTVQKLSSDQELRSVLCGAVYPLIGFVFPANFDMGLVAGEQVEIQGYVCWSKRNQVSEVLPKFEGILSQAMGRPVIIKIAGNIIYPPTDGVLFLSLATVNSVLLIMMMGIFLVPSLLFEEREAKTMQALLVSPASIGQVVFGKALAGLFYILVAAVILFSISWSEVIHWDMAILFVIGGSLFSVAVGLMLGSFFEKQQDTMGWMPAILLLMVGSVLVKMLGVQLPAFLESILPWIPSVALAEICRATFSEFIPVNQVWINLGIILAVALPLYAIVIWKVRRSDR